MKTKTFQIHVEFLPDADVSVPLSPAISVRDSIPRTETSRVEPQYRIGTTRCAGRAAFSGATIAPADGRAGTSQRDVPTSARLLLALVFAIFVSSIEAQSLINIDFGVGSRSSKVGLAATGQSTN